MYKLKPSITSLIFWGCTVIGTFAQQAAASEAHLTLSTGTNSINVIDNLPVGHTRHVSGYLITNSDPAVDVTLTFLKNNKIKNVVIVRHTSTENIVLPAGINFSNPKPSSKLPPDTLTIELATDGSLTGTVDLTIEHSDISIQKAD